MKGFKKKGKFIPTDKTITGVDKRALGTKPTEPKLDNSALMKEKNVPMVSVGKIQSLNDGQLKDAIKKVNGIFSGQTNYLQKNNNEFDERVTKENHEKTLDTLNALISEQTRRKTEKEIKKKH